MSCIIAYIYSVAGNLIYLLLSVSLVGYSLQSLPAGKLDRFDFRFFPYITGTSYQTLSETDVLSGLFFANYFDLNKQQS